MFFEGKNVLLIVTGGISVYKSVYFLRLLQRKKANVRVAMTKAALRFMSPLIFSALSKYPVLKDIFQNNGEIEHIKWAHWPQFIFVVPATANFIAKVAHGIADDAPTSTILASEAPKVIAPAMNNIMWENPATQRNLKRLEKDSILIILPTKGFLAEGNRAYGRLPDPQEILEESQIRLKGREGNLKNQKILISVGGD